MFKKSNNKNIDQIKEEDEEKYLKVMDLFDELISIASQRKPGIVGGLKKNKENLRNTYVNNLYGSANNISNPYINQMLFKQTIPKLKREIENLNIIIDEDKQKQKILKIKEKKAEKFLKGKIHSRADDEFSLLLKWMQEIHDDYLLIFNKINFEIFTKRKIIKLNDSLFKYSNSHTNSLLKQYIYELDNSEKYKKGEKYNNFHIKYMETVLRDWYWLYDTAHWIIKKENSGEKMLNNPDEPIIFSDEELELESNKRYADLFYNKTQMEAFKMVANLVDEIYNGLGIEKLAYKFNIELRPL